MTSNVIVSYHGAYAANNRAKKYRALEITPADGDDDVVQFLAQKPTAIKSNNDSTTTITATTTTTATKRWFIKEAHNAPDGSVLCSSSATYRMKRVETSNSVFVVGQPIDSAASAPSDGCAVLTLLNCYYECLPTVAVMQRVHERLIDAGRRGVSFGELLRVVPGSARELRQTLRAFHAIVRKSNSSSTSNSTTATTATTATTTVNNNEYDDENNDIYFIVDDLEKTNLLKLLLAEVELQDMSFDSVDVPRIVTALQQIEPDRNLVESILRYYALPSSTSTTTSSATTIALNVDEVALFIVRCLLKQRAAWLLSDLLREWRSMLPPRVPLPSLDRLVGIAIIYEPTESQVESLIGVTMTANSASNSSSSTTAMPASLSSMIGNARASATSIVVLCERTSLAADPLTRLRQLFTRRSRWRLTDLCVYVGDLMQDATAAQRFVLKHCRLVADGTATTATTNKSTNASSSSTAATTPSTPTTTTTTVDARYVILK